ncbi:uncharacterized mitochondrial protein AtMg00860-like [Salvia miltiorrhiza]|uniref:uncharacterized mitochondrial protein AtMg00860-like n=1 Tax=Salvia miltiorrhiza TaxID=226208 RepID=UPI0025AC8D5B|nr:uncharacterized mitochondrial protein AtMg00860-like [Salvia miltiorrhiza]
MADHYLHLQSVFDCLITNQYCLKLSKCVFGQISVDYLGHILTNGCVMADPSKLSAMETWPVPKTQRQLRAFLGLTGYYRRFVRGYAGIAAPLTDLLRKDSFQWTPAAQEAFDALKAAMTSVPVLHLPHFEHEFIVETDASNVGMGAVLMQLEHPIAFFSKKLGPRLQAASTYMKELYAITESVRKWRQYLL